MKNICKSCSLALCQGRVPIFKDLSNEELDFLSSIIRHDKYNKGELIFSEGEVSDKLRIIHKGEVKIYKVTIDGKEQILDILGAGDFTGELDLFKSGKYNFNAKAIEESLVCSIDQNSIIKLINENPSIGIKIISAMNEKLVRLQNLAQNLATNDSYVRLISLILDLYEKNNFNKSIRLNLTREELANYCGLTRETISRRLMSLKKLGYIDVVGNKEIIIKDYDGLKNYLP